MGQLGDWAKKNSKTLILDDGETVEVVYEGFKIGVNPFDPEKEIVFYRLKLDGLDGPMAKAFKSTSGKAARFFDGIEFGTKVKITRHGVGNETKYEFAVLGAEITEEVKEQDDTDVPF